MRWTSALPRRAAAIHRRYSQIDLEELNHVFKAAAPDQAIEETFDRANLLTTPASGTPGAHHEP